MEAGGIVIVGAGLAGLTTALKLAPLPVTVVSAAPVGQGASSAWAQGGIAAAIGDDDSAAAHSADTIKAGAGIVDDLIARITTSEAADRIADLTSYGVPFDRDADGTFIMSREAAHSARRVVRVAGDGAGKAIMQALINRVHKTPSIKLLAGFEALDLSRDGNGTLNGIVLWANTGPDAGHMFHLPANAVVLATGGIGYLYSVTTNPHYARGDAIAMAARAGAVIADAEFVQFHPTAIDAGLDPAPLATEALRGEGAILINNAGERFMIGQHPDAELAPRDIVARGVFREIKAGRGALLDCRDAVGAAFRERYPTVYKRCMAAGIDPVTAPIPIAPAEHYHMGGIATDAKGRASIAGLWGCGEVTSTGLHGANRLASNSLLEAVVFGARVADDISQYCAGAYAQRDARALAWGGAGSGTTSDSTSDYTGDYCADIVQLTRLPPVLELMADDKRDAMIVRLRETMHLNAGVERNAAGLTNALNVINELSAMAGSDMRLANMVLAARFVVTAALARQESRGGHYRSDFPEANPANAYRSYLTLADLDKDPGQLSPTSQAGPHLSPSTPEAKTSL